MAPSLGEKLGSSEEDGEELTLNLGCVTWIPHSWFLFISDSVAVA